MSASSPAAGVVREPAAAALFSPPTILVPAPGTISCALDGLGTMAVEVQPPSERRKIYRHNSDVFTYSQKDKVSYIGGTIKDRLYPQLPLNQRAAIANYETVHNHAREAVRLALDSLPVDTRPYRRKVQTFTFVDGLDVVTAWRVPVVHGVFADLPLPRWEHETGSRRERPTIVPDRVYFAKLGRPRITAAWWKDFPEVHLVVEDRAALERALRSKRFAADFGAFTVLLSDRDQRKRFRLTEPPLRVFNRAFDGQLERMSKGRPLFLTLGESAHFHAKDQALQLQAWEPLPEESWAKLVDRLQSTQKGATRSAWQRAKVDAPNQPKAAPAVDRWSPVATKGGGR